METLQSIITKEMERVFELAGMERSLAKVTASNRPDLCEFQCNGAMAAAKKYKKAPLEIAEEVCRLLEDSPFFASAEAIRPGFINLHLCDSLLAEYLEKMRTHEKSGVEEKKSEHPVMIDYGGPNVAKPLHVGHLRSAIIGESVKRILSFKGDEVIGDIHLGDWGYQMGLIITELQKRKPQLPYFDESFSGDYPVEAPFTLSELEEIYPYASAYAKEHEEYRTEALTATFELQNGRRGYRALWRHIMDVSVADLKKNYEKLSVDFTLWLGESDVQAFIPGMVQRLKEEGYARVDEGALVVDVKEETDKKEVPPCMILKSDGAALYDTTDLATLLQRQQDYAPREVIYVVDKRQELHFIQVFRAAKKTGIVSPETTLTFMGFGTMNGADGRPFKTREGGVMRLETLISDITDKMYEKIAQNESISGEEARQTAQTVGLAAIKYGDLSNQASKDYVFDMDRFTSFEGNTGPYILYTIVRMKSILSKYEKADGCVVEPIGSGEPYARALALEAARFPDVFELVYEERAPHKLCAYIYELSNKFNKFYHETKILSEPDEKKRRGYIALVSVTKQVLETCIGLLGFSAPDRM